MTASLSSITCSSVPDPEGKLRTTPQAADIPCHPDDSELPSNTWISTDDESVIGWIQFLQCSAKQAPSLAPGRLQLEMFLAKIASDAAGHARRILNSSGEWTTFTSPSSNVAFRSYSSGMEPVIILSVEFDADPATQTSSLRAKFVVRNERDMTGRRDERAQLAAAQLRDDIIQQIFSLVGTYLKRDYEVLENCTTL